MVLDTEAKPLGPAHQFAEGLTATVDIRARIAEMVPAQVHILRA